MNALLLSRLRRERLDGALCRTLGMQRQERAAQEQRYDVCSAKAEAESTVLQASVRRIDEMTSGAKPFGLDEFNRRRGYIQMVAERHRASVAELENERAALDACAAAIAETQRKIVANHVRCELISKRVRDLTRELDGAEADRSDEEAQEIAVARFIDKRRRAS